MNQGVQERHQRDMEGVGHTEWRRGQKPLRLTENRLAKL